MSKRMNWETETMRACRELGWVVDRVSYRMPYRRKGGGAGNLVDYLHCIDLIALNVEQLETIGIQATYDGKTAPHFEKMRTECRREVVAWLLCGNVLEIWDWQKRAGGRRVALRRQVRIDEESYEVSDDEPRQVILGRADLTLVDAGQFEFGGR